jgi:hypothetical protein
MKLQLLTLGAALATLTACGGGGSTEPAPAPVKTEAPKPAEPAAPVSNYTGGPVTDGGTVSGTVTYTGTETDGKVAVTKDTEVCVLHAGETEHPARTLVVADGKLANVFVWIDGMTKGKAFTPGTVTIDNVHCSFEPHAVVGHVGGKVAAKNSDPILHNTNLTLTEGGKNIANIALPTQGQVVEKDLRKAGMVHVKCDAHEWMEAWMLVADHPYATVTDATGAYTLPEVPAGNYTLKFWHEKLGEKSQPITVAAAGTATADQAF